MAKIRLVVVMGALVAATGCAPHDATLDTRFPEPVVVSGPPGGEMDQPYQPSGGAGGSYGDPNGSLDGYADPSGTYAVSGELEASADPNDPGYVMGQVTDAEIDQTLDGYGEWVDNADYGRMWRPYATVVGVDFTPYETCGSWVWTNDWGWVYGCDWDWGWLPFHYGRWGWFDDSWAWVPDYQWGPAWVDWRGGGDYVGWRPSAPIVRDHRGQHEGPEFHDHRSTAHAKQMESHWRFATVQDFGKHNIRAHLFKNPAEGIRATSIATRPPVRGTVQPVRAASVMRGRLASLGIGGNSSGWRGGRAPRNPIGSTMPGDRSDGGRGRFGSTFNNDTPTWRPHAPAASSSFGDSTGVWAPGASADGSGGTHVGSHDGGGPIRPSVTPGDRGIGADGDFGGSRPLPPNHHVNDASAIPGGAPESFGDPAQPEHQPWGHAGTMSPIAPTQVGGDGNTPTQPTWHPRGGGSYAPSSTVNPPIAPSQPTYNAPQRTWNPAASQPTYNPPQRTWTPPASTYNPPQRTWTPPASTYNPPQRTWTPPASTYNPPQRTYNPPARTFSAPSHSSWSPPASHSSGSFSPSRSSGSFSPSHSSGGGSWGGARRH